MKRLASFLAIAVGALAAAASVVERALGQLGPIGRSPIVSTVTVRVSPEAAWALLADVEGQSRWMHDAKRIRLLTPGAVREGTLAEADVRIFGLGTTDRVEVVTWQPPALYAIEHVGRFRGRGEFVLSQGLTPGTTEIRWTEDLRPPILPNVSALLLRPILGRIFQADLERFAQLLEAGGIGGEAPGRAHGA